MGCLVVTSNSVKLKSISSWPKMRAKTTENHFRFHFYFKWFPALENRRERERARERERGRKKEERVEIVQSRACRYCPPTSPAPRRSREASIAIDASREAPTAPIAISPSHQSRSREVSGFDDFFFGCFLFFFVFWGMNDIIYSFGNRENVRKCEQQVQNVFSIVFSRTQPNIRKYFLKCNQTHENIFLSGK